MDRSSRLIAGFVCAKVALHLSLAGRYDYHGDELYFIECAKHLAWGYVDHPPMIAWLARLASPFDYALVALRIPSIVAGGATMYLTLRMARDWGGEAWALTSAGLGVLLAPVYLRMHSMLDIPAIELFLWTAGSYGVARIHAGADPRHWLTVGAIAGLGLLTKHSMGLWGIGLLLGMLATEMRAHFRTRWPWLGGLLALAIALPNVVWLSTHGWATLEFLANMREMLAATVSRPLFAAGLLLYLNPIAAPIWIAGLWALFRRDDMPRVLGWIWIVGFITLLLTGGKPYYLAPAFPALLAAGGIALENAWRHRPRTRIAYASTFVLTGIGFALLVLPVLPVQSIDRGIDAMFGWAVPSQALTHDLHAEFGWRDNARAVRAVVRSLPEAEGQVTLLAHNYSSASAVRFFAPDLPPATSGHLTYWLWGPQPGEVVVAWGMSASWLRDHFRECRPAGHIHAPLARTHEREVRIDVCRGSTAEHWAALRNYDNSGAHPSVATDTSALRRE